MTNESSDSRPRGRVSLLFGQQVDELQPILEYARFCESNDLRLWLGQSSTIESHAALAAVAGYGISVETGLGVTVAPLRTPLDAFTQARSIAKLMGRPIAAGYGMGSASFAQRLLGRDFTSPADYMATYVEQVRALSQAPNGGSGIDGTQPHKGAVEVGCGVLRPRMAQEAGRVADFAVTWLTPPGYLATTLTDALGTGAAKAGRPRPRLVSVVQCALAEPDRNPARLAFIGCGRHIGAPHYADMLGRAGVEITGDQASDLRSALRSGLFSYGSASDIAAVVNSYWSIGVDEVVLNIGSVGLEHGTVAALRDVEQVLGAVEPTGSENLSSMGR